MKNTLVALIFVLGLFAGTLYADGNRDVWSYQDFSSGTFPPAGWTISSNAANWSANASANAGGVTPELRLNWSPQFNGATYFISPSFDTTGQTEMFVDFKHFVDYYDTPFGVGLATRGSATAAWNNVWTISPTDDVGPEIQTITINNADMGSSTFQFALFFSGSSYNIDYWYVDDIKFYIPFPYDLAIPSASLPNNIAANTPVTPACTIKNVGLTDLTAIVSLSIYRGATMEAAYNDYYSEFLAMGQEQTVTFPSYSPDLADELYRYEFIIRALENIVDQDLANNTLSKYVNTWTGAKQMVILEIGTGAWCTYCPGAAMAADDFIDGAYNVAVIENHNGDPFATDHSNGRNTYYGISGYPTGFFDGTLSYVGGNHTTSVFPAYLPLYEQRNAVKTPLDLHIYGVPTREGYSITLAIDKNAPTAYSDVVAHLTMTESNIAYVWQGQTNLNFVNRMMYPGLAGTEVNLDSMPIGPLNMTTMQITKDASWVTANCELVYFLQNLNTKEIIQGTKVALTALEPPPVANDDNVETPLLSTLNSVSPNPFTDKASICYSLKGSSDVSINIYNVKGQLVRTLVSGAKTAGAYEIAWNGCDQAGKHVANGAYIVKLQSGTTVITKKLMLLK